MSRGKGQEGKGTERRAETMVISRKQPDTRDGQTQPAFLVATLSRNLRSASVLLISIPQNFLDFVAVW